MPLFLLLCVAVLATGCATTASLPGHGVLLGYSRSERDPGTQLALVRQAEIAVRSVTSGAVTVDSFEELLTLAGLDDFNELPPRVAPLTPRAAARMLAVLLRKPVTLASFPPRMAASHLLREVLEGEAVSREELLRRVERFNTVAVLRPDGYLAWTRNGRTQQKVGPVEWRDDAFRAGPFALGRFYTGNGWVFRHTDARLRPMMDGPVLAEVYDDADTISRTLDGAEDAYVELYHAMGQLLTRPVESLVELRHLPAGMAALIASSPEFLEQFRYMTRGEQVKALSRLTTSLIVTWGAAGSTTRTLTRALMGAEATVPVLSLSAEGALAVERVVVPVGNVAEVLGSGPGAAIILYQTGTGGGGGGKRVSGDELEKLRKEFEAVKSKFWKHEAEARPGVYSPENVARMKQGKPPIGSDGFPMELHHKVPLAEGGSNAFENLVPLTRTEHRLGLSYKLNHPNLP
ncbi:HNH endonuclease signature motif containing protein [Archangium lipolyticum]|uniref:HNH endonuclease signature motif containing protein n=1 Tax=Archangium lipolyticum TaxID=2970465 RepID=UPI0027D46B7E|nr:HNH endonuclease signature motif containing protein [Archangium lipolyticum]